MNTDLDKTSKIIQKVLLSIKYYVFKVGEKTKKNRSVFFRISVRSRTGPLSELRLKSEPKEGLKTAKNPA